MKTPPTTRITLAGTTRVLTLYSIGWLARMCDKSVLTIRKWEREGILPRPLFLDDADMRWYTASEISVYACLVRKHGLGKGKSIKATNFPVEANQVRGRLRDLFVNSPADLRIMEALPQEQQLTDALLKSRKGTPNTDPWQINAISKDPHLGPLLRSTPKRMQE